MKRLSTALLLLIPYLIFGAFLTNVPMTLTQPDGEIIDVLTSGDEFHHWFHDSDNYTIMPNAAGYYVYSVKENNNIVPSTFVVGEVNPQAKSLTPGVNITAKEWKAKRDLFYANTPRTEGRTPSTGDLINVAIFVRFQGESEFTATIDWYDDMMNNTSTDANSVHNYYNEVSYGQINVYAEFYPPVDENNVIVSYEDIHPRGYFEAYSTSNTIGYQGGDQGNERSQREQDLLARAAEYVESMIPEDLAIDGDNDGYVDNVIYIIKGSPNNWASLLWPHRWSLYYATAYIHGKQVYDYNFQMETHLNSSGSSVMCHELFHSLGAPDLYRYETEGDPVGVWDLMASNTTPPQHMNSYMKHYYGNWIHNIPTIEDSGSYYVLPISSDEHQVFKIPSWNYNEEIYVEYRRVDELFEGGLPSGGLLIYKINGDVAGQGNAGGPPDEVFVYRPGGTWAGGGNLAYAPFTNERASFGFDSNPPANGTNGLFAGIDIYNINVENDSVSFDIDIANIYLTSLNNGEALVAGGDVIVEWIAKNSVNQIELEYSDNGGNDWISIAQVAANTGSYTWQLPTINSDAVLLRAHDLSGDSYDVINHPLIVVSDLAVPTLLEPVDNATSVATNPILSWNAINGAIQYNILLSSQEDFSTTLIDEDVDETQLEIEGIDAHSTFYWKVRAINSDLLSDYSEVFTFNTGDFTSAPTTPLLVSPTNNSIYVSYDEVTFAWQVDPSAETYTLQVCPNVYFFSDLIEEADIVETSAVVNSLTPGTRYYWRVKAHNSAGNSSYSNIFTFTTEAVVSNENNSETVISELLGNYPNPFNPETTIDFVVGNELKRSSQKVVGRVYNIKGQMVKELIHAELTPNKYSLVWKGVDSHGNSVASGVYYMRLKIGSKTINSKMVLMK